MEYPRLLSVTYCIFVTFVSLFERTFQFNLETRLPVIKNGPVDSYFGFSVAEHITDKNRIRGPAFPTSFLLVGAPLFQDDSLPYNRTGAVFKCPLTSSFDDCEQIEIEAVGDDDLEGQKDGQWLGVSVASQGRGGKASACAHRYKRVEYNADDEIESITPIGKCFLIEEDLTIENREGWVTCQGMKPVSIKGYSYCQAGTGLAISKDAEFIVGSPGAGYWRGAMTATNNRFVTWWSAITDESVLVKRNSYFGFSTSSGMFAENEVFFIGGAPRANATGAVVIMEKPASGLRAVDKIVSDSPYSSFGYSVAVADLNGDGFDDIIVGAPMYYNRTSQVGGAVYIFINEAMNGTFSGVTPTIITGPLDSRFGMAVTSMGDSNFDGYEDFAVGAPYENDGQGAVYVYLGSADGVVQPWAQRITPSDFPTELQNALLPNDTFGYSLSGGLDLDGNSFPDLLVGALDSESVILLRARPAISMTATVNVTPEALDPQDPNCDVGGEAKLCFVITVCAQYYTDSSYDKEIDVVFDVEAESKRLSLGLNSRVYFEGAEPDHILANQTLMLHSKYVEMINCAPPIQAVLRDDFSDIYRPIPLKVTFSLPNQPLTMPPPGEKLPDMDATVMFDHSVITTLATEVEFTKECALNDGVCIADLVVDAEFQNLAGISDSGNPLLKVGIDSVMQLKVDIANREEEAYDAKLIVEYSNDLVYAGIMDGATERVRYSCGEPVAKEDGNDTMVLTCALGNPYPKEPAKDSMVMQFDATGVPPDAGSLEFYLYADRTNEDSTPADNEVRITVDVESVTDIQLDGVVSKSQYFYGGVIRGESAIESEEEIGPLVIQTWTVFNHGPASVEDVTVTINFPYEVINGKWLLYMVQEPVIVTGNGTCTVDESMINVAEISPCAENCTEPSATKKRNTYDPSDYSSPDQLDPSLHVNLDCERESARCFPIVCVFQEVSAVPNENQVVMEISARLWNATFMEDFLQVRKITVRIHGSVVMEENSVVTQTNTDNDRDTTNFDVVSPNLSTRTQGVAWWIILIAILLGLLLLILLIVILWKIGFFRRPFASGGSGGPCGFFERKTGYQYSSVTKKHSEANVGTEKRQMYDEMYDYSQVPSSEPNSPHQL